MFTGLVREVGTVTSMVDGRLTISAPETAQGVQLGDTEIVVAGGMESMSNAPYLIPKAREGYRMGNGLMVDTVIQDGLR